MILLSWYLILDNRYSPGRYGLRYLQINRDQNCLNLFDTCWMLLEINTCKKIAPSRFCCTSRNFFLHQNLFLYKTYLAKVVWSAQYCRIRPIDPVCHFGGPWQHCKWYGFAGGERMSPALLGWYLRSSSFFRSSSFLRPYSFLRWSLKIFNLWHTRGRRGSCTKNVLPEVYWWHLS